MKNTVCNMVQTIQILSRPCGYQNQRKIILNRLPPTLGSKFMLER